MSDAMLRQFAELSAEEARLKADLRSVQEEKAKLKGPVTSYLVDNQIQNQTLTIGNRRSTIYLNHIVNVRAKRTENNPEGDYAAVTRALKEVGLDQFVQERWNANTLSAYVREVLADETQELPETLREAIDINDQVEARARTTRIDETKSSKAAKALS